MTDPVLWGIIALAALIALGAILDARSQRNGVPVKLSRPVKVRRVVDGDTIDVGPHPTARVRIIGIDTPETVHPHKAVEFYGPEASAEAKRLLQGKTVRLGYDPLRRGTDGYKRVLAYVVLPDGSDYGEHMIRNGYAKEMTFAGRPYLRQRIYRKAQWEAQRARIGLWS